MNALDRWSARQEDTPSRPEAIRRLVAMAIASTQPSAPISKMAVAKAADMAGEMVDFLGDQSALADVRENESAVCSKALLSSDKCVRIFRRGGRAGIKS